MMHELISNITNDQLNPELRAIILTGEGSIFSSGHNLKELTPERNQDEHRKVFSTAVNLMKVLIDAPVPIIARVDGLAAAAGCQLVAQCDLVLCTQRSQFSTPGANFGIFCSTPGIPLARAIPKSVALKMLLTGRPIDGNEAKAAGLVNDVYETSTELDCQLIEICNEIRSKSRSVIKLGKKFYYQQINSSLIDAYNMGAEKMVENLQMEDGKEGIRSFVEKRQPQWKKT